MTRYLCISVIFLDPLYHGRTEDGRGGEWPPSPFRLFQALLAGSRAGCRNAEWSEEKAAAFRWLERLPPPEILAARERQGASYTLFVPNNDSDKKFARQGRLTSKPAWSHWLLDEYPVHYLWPISEGQWNEPQTQEAAQLICRQATCLLALGWRIDQVVAHGRILSEDEAATIRAAAPTRWQPCHGAQWRVPTSGTFDDLERVYHEFCTTIQLDGTVRVPGRPRQFVRVDYRRAGSLPPRYCAAFALRSLGDLQRWRAFRAQDANVVAAMLRSLVCSQKDDFSVDFPEEDSEVYLAGHVNGADQTPPRFSYLPLPTIGVPHADGMIRRVLVVEPLGGNGRHAAWIRRRLHGRELRDPAGQPVAVLEELSPDTVVRHYYPSRRPARTWKSVTPIILPGYDDFATIRAANPARLTKAERLALKALEQAGIPAAYVEHLTLRKAPFWPGSLHPQQYRRPDYLRDQCARPGWHISLVFREPVAGPLAIGAGRHCGLGVLAAES